MAYNFTQSTGDELNVHSVSYNLYRNYMKRFFDILFTLIFGLPILIVIGILAIFVAKDGHSVFYSQPRVGRNGKVFHMWKLRSMVPDADRKLTKYLAKNPDAKREWTRNQKLANDPRITAIGRIIRKTSLDELPQFWNVLRGEMSLVGPRPFLCQQRELYNGRRYFEMRPGLSGYWQTSVRNESSFAERAYYDREYYYDLSIRTDFMVLVRTIGVVLRSKGC